MEDHVNPLLEQESFQSSSLKDHLGSFKINENVLIKLPISLESNSLDHSRDSKDANLNMPFPYSKERNNNSAVLTPTE